MTIENMLREGTIKTCEDKNKNSGYQRFSSLIDRRKAMTNLDSTLKNRDTALPTKADIIKAMVFSVVMYRCKSWTIK